MHQHADDDGPDARPEEGEAEDGDGGGELRRNLDPHDALHLEAAIGLVEFGREEAAKDGREAGDGEELAELRLRIEFSEGEGEEPDERIEEEAARDLDCIGRIEEAAALAIWAVDDGGADAEIAKELKAKEKDGDKRHQPEGFAIEQSREREVDRELHDVDRDRCSHRKEGA